MGEDEIEQREKIPLILICVKNLQQKHGCEKIIIEQFHPADMKTLDIKRWREYTLKLFTFY